MLVDHPAELSREETSILLLARAERTGAEAALLRTMLADPNLDWDRFWNLAEEHEVRPLMAVALGASDIADALPSSARDQAKAVRLESLFSNMSRHAELLRVARALSAAGIPVAPLKGTHIAERFYHALEARRTGDIDILVRESDLGPARAILKELGYALLEGVTHGIEEHSFHGVPYLRVASAGTFVLELHWGLNDPRWVNIDYGSLWQRILANSDRSEILRPLPTEETLVFLAVHHPKHADGLLRLLADIDRLVREQGLSLDWAYVTDLAARWKASSLLFVALHRAQLLYGTPVPIEVIARLRPASWRRAAIGLLAGTSFILRPPAALHMRTNQSTLAYCAMLNPASSVLRAYATTFYPSSPAEPEGIVTRLASLATRLGHGVAWTALVLCNATFNGRRIRLPSPPSAPPVGEGAPTEPARPASLVAESSN